MLSVKHTNTTETLRTRTFRVYKGRYLPTAKVSIKINMYYNHMYRVIYIEVSTNTLFLKVSPFLKIFFIHITS